MRHSQPDPIESIIARQKSSEVDNLQREMFKKQVLLEKIRER